MLTREPGGSIFPFMEARYELNPDFRRNPKTANYCVRCQKDIADPSTAIRVTVDWETWLVTLGGKELLGRDCAKRIGIDLQLRDDEGRYDYDGGENRTCVCCCILGVHAASAPHECIAYSLPPDYKKCDCPKFRQSRRKANTETA